MIEKKFKLYLELVVLEHFFERLNFDFEPLKRLLLRSNLLHHLFKFWKVLVRNLPAIHLTVLLKIDLKLAEQAT